MARALRTWTISRREKTWSVTLRYGPRTRLVRGMYEDFDWPKLLRENLLKKRFLILDLYINHHNLSRETNLRKKNKLDVVTAHFQMSLASTNVHVSNISNGHTNSTESESSTEPESSTDSEKCEDFVLNEVGSDSPDDDVPRSSLVLNSKNAKSVSESDLPLSVLRVN